MWWVIQVFSIEFFQNYLLSSCRNAYSWTRTDMTPCVLFQEWEHFPWHTNDIFYNILQCQMQQKITKKGFHNMTKVYSRLYNGANTQFSFKDTCGCSMLIVWKQLLACAFILVLTLKAMGVGGGVIWTSSPPPFNFYSWYLCVSLHIIIPNMSFTHINL